MAVTIDEMHVDTVEAQANPASEPSAGASQAQPDVRVALELLNERELRLRTD
jgi:hypothetical protein